MNTQNNTAAIYYVKATASWKDSVKKGKHFVYTDTVIKDCIIMVSKGEAIITYRIGGNTYTAFKRISGKYFTFKGREVTQNTFFKHQAAMREKAEAAAVELDRLNEERARKYAEAKEAMERPIREEAEMIGVDAKFIEDVAVASLYTGPEKSTKSAGALKMLLERRGLEKVHTDFWAVYRLLKKKIEALAAEPVNK